MKNKMFGKTVALIIAALMIFTLAPGVAMAEENSTENQTGAESEELSVLDSVIASGTCGDNATWSLSSDGVLTIGGSGDMKDYSFVDYELNPWYSYKDSIKTISIGSEITRIGNKAFIYCSNLTSIIFADDLHLTSIGDSAFYSCNSLTSLQIPSGITSIGEGAFQYCNNLTSLEIPSSVTSIGKYLFVECSPWLTLYLNSGSYAETYAKLNTIIYVSTNLVSLKQTSYNYTGKAITPTVIVENSFGYLLSPTKYTVKYTNNVNVGTATAQINFNCGLQVTKSFKINPAKNPMKLKAYSAALSYKTLNSEKLAYAITFKTKAQGKVTYTLSKAAKKAKIKVTSKGKIIIPKKCKKGTYRITVKANGNTNYKAGKATFKLIVK